MPDTTYIPSMQVGMKGVNLSRGAADANQYAVLSPQGTLPGSMFGIGPFVFGAIGDSRIVQCITIDSAGHAYNDQGLITWLINKAGVLIKEVYTSAAVNRRVNEMVALSPAELDKYNPDIVFIFGFINSCDQYPVSTAAEVTSAANIIFNDFNTLLDYSLNLGRVVITGLEVPNDSLTTNQKKLIPIINRMIKNKTDNNLRSMVLLDFYTDLVDVASTVGNPLTGMLDDNIHFSTKGAWTAVSRDIAKFAALFPPVQWPMSRSDDRTINSASQQWIRNPMMQVGGGVTGTASNGCSGSVPDDWFVTSTNAGDSNVCSIVASPFGPGSALRILPNTLGVSRISVKSSNIIGLWTAARKLQALGKVKVAVAGTLKSMSVNFNMNSTTAMCTSGRDTGSAVGALPDNFTHPLITPVVIPIGLTALRVEFYFEFTGATATTDIILGLPALNDLTDL